MTLDSVPEWVVGLVSGAVGVGATWATLWAKVTNLEGRHNALAKEAREGIAERKAVDADLASKDAEQGTRITALEINRAHDREMLDALKAAVERLERTASETRDLTRDIKAQLDATAAKPRRRT